MVLKCFCCFNWAYVRIKRFSWHQMKNPRWSLAALWNASPCNTKMFKHCMIWYKISGFSMLGSSVSSWWINWSVCGSWSMQNLNFPTEVCQKSPSELSSELRFGLSAESWSAPTIDGRAIWTVACATSASDSVTDRATAVTIFSDGIIAARSRSSWSETVSTVAVMIWVCKKSKLKVSESGCVGGWTVQINTNLFQQTFHNEHQNSNVANRLVVKKGKYKKQIKQVRSWKVDRVGSRGGDARVGRTGCSRPVSFSHVWQHCIDS